MKWSHWLSLLCEQAGAQSCLSVTEACIGRPVMGRACASLDALSRAMRGEIDRLRPEYRRHSLKYNLAAGRGETEAILVGLQLELMT